MQKILVLKQDGTEDEYITISSLVDLKEALSKINKLSAFSESATKLLDMLGTQSEIKTDIIDSWIKGQDDSTRYSISDLQVAIESELNKIKEQDQIQKKQDKIEIDINIDISEKPTSNYIGLFGDKKLEVASGTSGSHNALSKDFISKGIKTGGINSFNSLHKVMVQVTKDW